MLCISRLNIHYYHNRRYKSYITSLKAVIAGKSLIFAGLDIDRILHFVFMIKYSKFTDNIGSGNFTDTFCKIPTNLKKVCACVCVCGGGEWGVLRCCTPPTPLGTPVLISVT